MIKCENGAVNFSGYSDDLLAEYGTITMRLVERLSEQTPKENVIMLMSVVFHHAIKIAGASEEEIKQKSRQLEVMKILMEREEK